MIITGLSDAWVSVVFAKFHSSKVTVLYSNMRTLPWFLTRVLKSDVSGHVEEFSWPIAIIEPVLLNWCEEPNATEYELELSPVIVSPNFVQVWFSDDPVSS